MLLRLLDLDNRGQTTLVIVVLVMVVSLAVGVAASNRAISNIRRVSYTSQGDQALHCAEAGAEDALAKINSDLSSGGSPVTSGFVPPVNLKDTEGVNICNYSYSISDFAGSVLTYPLVLQDDAQEINLDGYSGTLNLYFGSNKDASLEVTFVKGGSPPYSIEKYAYNCNPHSNGFDSPKGGGQDLPCSTGEFAGISGYKIARVRPLYADTKIVAVFSSQSPSQGYIVDSKGTAADAQRNVQVVRTRAQLPAIFDYGIFSASSSEPLGK